MRHVFVEDVQILAGKINNSQFILSSLMKSSGGSAKLRQFDFVIKILRFHERILSHFSKLKIAEVRNQERIADD
jgi:hypothetical protein